MQMEAAWVSFYAHRLTSRFSVWLGSPVRVARRGGLSAEREMIYEVLPLKFLTLLRRLDLTT
jgi:hypothetical protein